MVISPSSDPVQRTVSSPSGLTWSNPTAPSRNSSSSDEEAGDPRQHVGGVTAERAERHRPAAPQPVDHQGGLLLARSPSVHGGARRTSPAPAWAPSPSRRAPRTPAARCRSGPRAAGSRSARRGRPREGTCGTRLPAAARGLPATCLKALYCSRRANSRSRASSSAKSSSSSTSPCGSSRAALRSSSVEATTRKDDVCSRSHSGPPALMCAMNSSVTFDSATSVMSSLCLAIRLSSRSNGTLEVVELQCEPGRGLRLHSCLGWFRGSLRSHLNHRGSRHACVSCLTSALSSPLASRSAKARDTAARTSRPRSIEVPSARRSVSRACSRSSSSSERDVDGHLLVVLDPARVGLLRSVCCSLALGPLGLPHAGGLVRILSNASSSMTTWMSGGASGTAVGRNRSSASGMLTRRDNEQAPPWPANGRPRHRSTWRRTS